MRPLLPLLLLGCPDPDGPDPDGDSDTDLPAGCEVLDCADPACAEAFECTWPTSLEHESDFTFTGATIQCPVGPVTLPVDVPDCAIALSAALTERLSGDLCPACDRTFEGPITYSQDTCSEVLGQTPPSSGAWGLVFVSPDERELWLPDGAGGWALSSTLTRQADGAYTSSASESITQVPPSCGSAAQHVGDVVVTARFMDP